MIVPLHFVLSLILILVQLADTQRQHVLKQRPYALTLVLLTLAGQI